MKLNVLTAGCTNPNGCAFLYPLIRYRDFLRSCGIDVHFPVSIESAVENCDVLLVENKYFGSRWSTASDSVLADLQWCKDRVGSLLYMDITDSTGWDHAKALPIVTAYLKNQLLKDRTEYLRPMYGYRPFTNYFKNKFGVEDDEPGISAPIKDSALLGRLGVGWNSGLADWSLNGPVLMTLYRHTGWRRLLGDPKGWVSPSRGRTQDVACRFSVQYARATVSWQRMQIRRIMKKRLGTEKLNRRAYFKELRNSKLIVSPFGLGEITLKDFEVFISGGLLFKPDMSHMETWPDLFKNGETMVAHRWDLEDFTERMDLILANYDRYLDVAREGQRRYQSTVMGKLAGEAFAQHLSSILERDWSQPWVAYD